jgi:hypothetical protein
VPSSKQGNVCTHGDSRELRLFKLGSPRDLSIVMRWHIFTILGVAFLAFGIALIAYASNIPVYYAGGGTGVSVTGRVVGELAPRYCKIPIITVPNTIHIHARSIEPVIVRIDAPNGTNLALWENATLDVEYPVVECGFWHVYISQPSNYFVYGEVFATAPLHAHPALMYASIPTLLGAMSLRYSIYKRKQVSNIGDIQFEQNVGGRWVFLAWIPILAIISQALLYIPSFPWLYALLIAVTVMAVFFSFALAYIKIFLSDKYLYIEAPFLNFHKDYDRHQIMGYSITRERKHRLFGFRTIPSWRPKKEDQVSLFILDPLPKWIWMTSLSTRLQPNKIVFRPKSTEKFVAAAKKLDIAIKEIAEI